MSAALTARLRAVRSDPLVANSVLVLLTTVLMAGAGAVFWVIAARLASPADVGLAGSLVAAGDSLALFAQVGLNIAVMRTLPASDRKAADVLTSGTVVVATGAGFALAYCLLLPVTSPRLGEVLGSPLAIAIYCALVAATALNVLSDAVFLSIDRVRSYLRLNGLLLGVAKCSLPFLLAGAGAMGLYGSVGGAILLCAAASIWVILRHLPGPRSLTPSREFLAARRFAGAGYATYVLTVLPLLVFPVLVINALGSATGASYFISFQVVSLQHALILAVANATYAEAERTPHGRRRVVAKGGLTLLACAAAGTLVMLLVAPLLLRVFGHHYVAGGTATLRVLSLATVAAAFNYWSAVRLRLSGNLRAMILVQLASTLVMLGLAGVLVPLGTVWVGVAWGAGHLVGGVLGYVASRTVARIPDDGPVAVAEHADDAVAVAEQP